MAIKKKRIYPSVFDVLSFKYMFREKCSWCNSGHDARSKYEITDTKFKGKVFYSMTCYNDYKRHYKQKNAKKHKVEKKISLFGVSHNRLIGGTKRSDFNNNYVSTDAPSSSEIHSYPKDFIITSLIGKDFIVNGSKCTMEEGSGSANTIWIIKKGFWGTHVIQANKLRKSELIQLYMQVFD